MGVVDGRELGGVGVRQCNCLICGQPIIRGTPWLHMGCIKGPGWDLSGPFRTWPEWAKALKRDEQAMRRNSPCDVEVISLDELLEREGE